ncbi:MAG: hypothetical protein PHT54_01495 [Candidatus Nanoarchaeia archaeon]|nr:hypothetical protein [Candidatus Nanoarchaeia archaeon]
MKKIIGMTILLVFLLGIIPSGILAKENGQGNGNDGLEEETNEIKNQGEDIQIRTMEQGADDEDETEDEESDDSGKKTWQERFENVIANKERALNKIKIDKAKENFLRAKEKFEKSKLEFEEKKLAWEEAKKARKECTENCTEKETKLIEHVKEVVTRSADKMISHLEKVKSKIESNEEITEEEATELIAAIDAEIKNIEDLKVKVGAATTREELKEIAKEINQAWNRIREKERLAVTLNAKNSLVNLMERLGTLGDNLEVTIADAKTAGTEIGEAETYMTEFDAKMVLAEEAYTKFTAKIEDAKAKTGDEKLAVLKEAKTYFEDMRNNLKAAHEALKKAYKELKANGIKPNIIKEVD